MRLLIDGYNLLYATGLLGPGIGPGGLERSRMALVNFLAASLEPAELAQTTVVFDAPSHGRTPRFPTRPSSTEYSRTARGCSW
jgi:predicted RNA-binding protein with PIN domain